MLHLPTTKKEVEQRGWSQLDVILFTGDAYVDHPSFGVAVIGRLLESIGLKVAIVPQPNWQDDGRDFTKLGTPRLFFGVTSGNMDSMVNHYTANKRLRSNDAYTPSNEPKFRPDYATYVYTNKLRSFFPQTPIIIGGIEASLRRVTHYDYWQDTLKPPILVECPADLLVYGMGEKAILEITHLLQKGIPINQITGVQQIVYKHKLPPSDEGSIMLSGFAECSRDKISFANNFKHVEQESNKYNAKTLVEPLEEGYLIINPPYEPMNEEEIDRSFDLPYTYLPHPKYAKRGYIPAYEMIKFSVNMHRGCFGGCSFCTISAHQGKFVASRSKASVLSEVKKLSKLPFFKGVLSDVGGPSANMYQMKGKDLEKCKQCARPSCIYPKVCENLDTRHDEIYELYDAIEKVPEVKKLFVGSGIRYDLAFSDGEKYLKRVIKKHTSGRFKVAPEHSSDRVLKLMRKPSFDLYYRLKQLFEQVNHEEGKRQQIVPYMISGHPGCTTEDMKKLRDDLKSVDCRPEQVQDFTPTPLTLSSVMYYTGIHPYTKKKVHIVRSQEEKRKQKDFFFYYKREQERPGMYKKRNSKSKRVPRRRASIK